MIAHYRLSAELGAYSLENTACSRSGGFFIVQSVLYSTYTHSTVHMIHVGQEDLRGSTILASSVRVYVGQRVQESAVALQL